MLASDLVLRFLRSIGREGAADYYLELFRAEDPERFALIAVEPEVAQQAADALAVDLLFLTRLGLTPVLVFASEDDAELVVASLDDSVTARRVEPGRAAATTRETAIPIIVTGELAPLAAELRSRKVVLLGSRAGLAPPGEPIRSIVDVTAEGDALTARLDPEQAAVFALARALVEAARHRMTVSVTSPLDLLRELFTVRGAGTLIRRGARVEATRSFDGVDRSRLDGLMASAFGRKPVAAFYDRAPDRIYIADDYRGAAVIIGTSLGGYLSKFAVEVSAQGEGIGGDLWRAMAADYPTIFWRARPGNPIAGWYQQHCDGFARHDEWHVFWRGLGDAEIPEAIAYARRQPRDF